MTVTRGWCPTLFEPMASGDGMLVRVKPSRATISAEQANVIADASRRFGNGSLGLTNRGNIQVRGLTESTVPEFARAIVSAGLANPNPDAERRRNVLVSPLIGDDPQIHAATERIAAELEKLLTDDSCAALPSKFGIALDGGGVFPLGRDHADIAIALDRNDARIILADGTSAACSLCDVLGVCNALVRLCLAIAPGGRMSEALSVVPADQILGGAGLVCAGVASRPSPPSPIGFFAYAAAPRGALGVAPPFGHLDALTVKALAQIAARFGATLRITSFRTVLLAGISAAHAVAAAAACTDAGMIVEPDDSRLRVVACPGMPDCAQATVPAFADAVRIASLGLPGVVHVSGCAKGCAQAGAAGITLVGRRGSYDLVRNGRASGAPVRTALSISEACTVLADAAA